MGIKWKKKDFVSLICVITASFLIAVNLNTFVEQGGLIPGGFNGITKLIQRVALAFLGIRIPFSLINFLLNAFPAIVCLRCVGKKFTIFSIVMVLMTGFWTDILPVYHVTGDLLLISVFGGILNGFANSIALNGGSSSGGTDFIAMFLSEKYNIATWNYVLVLNAAVIVISGILFGFDIALYSIIFLFCHTQVLNLLDKRYQRKTIFIITKHPKTLARELMTLTNHGVTRFEGVGCYSEETKHMLYTVIGERDVKAVRKFIHEIDPKAFVNITNSEQLEGNFYIKPLE